MEFKKYKLKELATIDISSVDKKTKEGETPVRLCNFTDVYKNWAITKYLYPSLMKASAKQRDIEKFSIHRGQVAITKDSETRDDIGIPTYIADDFENVVLGYHCALITPNKNLDGKYLNAYLNTKMAKKYFEGYASGSGQRYTLTLDSINDIQIWAPNIDEQHRLVKILSDIDQKIALNTRMNAEFEAMAKQLYDYWFVQFDFPDENGKPYKSSGGKMVYNETLKRDIPEGWEVKNINQLADSYRGLTYNKGDLIEESDNAILVLRGNNIPSSGQFVYDGNTAYVDKSLISEDQRIRQGDIIITMSSGSKEHIGKCFMFQKDSKHTFGAFLSKFVPYTDFRYYVYLCMLSDYFKAFVKTTCNGTGINNLTNDTFYNVFFPIPNKSTLKVFEEVTQPIYEKVGDNQQEIERLTHLRDSLLPMLMNGQITVK